MRSFCLLYLTGLLCIGLVGCTAESANNILRGTKNARADRLTLSGSSTIAPLAADIAKRFEARQPGVRVDVQSGGSGKGIADVRMGVADIAMVSRPLMTDEDDLIAHPFAADGVGLIVHDVNPVQALSADQVIKIYTDEINNWRDLGGQDREITVVHKAEGRATLEVFLKHFGIDNLNVKGDVIVGENEHAVKTVAGTESAIGYVSIGTAEANIETGVPIRLLPLEGIDASTANVASGAFPMSRPLHLVTLESSSPLADEFIRFCQSEDVHDLVQSHYYVPLERESGIAQ